MDKKRIYLDNNATTPLHPEVKKIISEHLDTFGNPSSLHSFGREAKKLMEEARQKVAAFIGADPDEVFFVGSGSEANNTVLSIIPCDPQACTLMKKSENEIITTRIEHPCILETSKTLKKRGFNVSYIDVDQYGKVCFDNLNDILKQHKGLVSVMMANNEIGTIQDIQKICEMAHTHGCLFHSDAVQAVGKIPVNVKALNVDFLTISGHKIYGPKGIGALYVKKGTKFCPFIQGGHQEKGRRAGTENTLGIIGLGKAVEMRQKEMEEEETRLLEFKKYLKQEIEKNIPDIAFNGHPTDCLPGTLNVSFAGVEGEAILLSLDLEGIAVSTGSACASGSLDPSHVLLATGIPIERAHGSIRISLGRENTREEMSFVAKTLKQVMEKLRSISSAY